MQTVTFDPVQVIRSLLASTPAEEMFSRFCQQLYDHHTNGVHTIEGLKEKSEYAKGRSFEHFCVLCLQSTNQYTNIWLWAQVPDEVKRAMNLLNRYNQPIKTDTGIDIIAQNAQGYIAVQAKFRSKDYLTVKDLATFHQLVAMSPHWVACIVMTNCKDISNKIKRLPKHEVVGRRLLSNMPREQWMKMVGDYVEHRLSDLGSTEVGPGEEVIEIEIPARAALSPEELRAARLRRLQQ